MKLMHNVDKKNIGPTDVEWLNECTDHMEKKWSYLNILKGMK